MSSGIEQHPDMLLRLELGYGGTKSNRFGRRRAQVPDLEVEVHHRPLLPLDRRPHRSLIALCTLEHEERPLRGGGHNGRTRLLVPDVPSEEFGVEPRQCTRIRCLDRRPPPHAVNPGFHPRSLADDHILVKHLVTRQEQCSSTSLGVVRARWDCPLVERFRVGAPLNPLRDGLMYVGGSTGYTDYPTLGSSDSMERRNAFGSVTVG